VGGLNDFFLCVCFYRWLGVFPDLLNLNSTVLHTYMSCHIHPWMWVMGYVLAISYMTINIDYRGSID
jgi:hypothetical protein